MASLGHSQASELLLPGVTHAPGVLATRPSTQWHLAGAQTTRHSSAKPGLFLLLRSPEWKSQKGRRSLWAAPEHSLAIPTPQPTSSLSLARAPHKKARRDLVKKSREWVLEKKERRRRQGK